MRVRRAALALGAVFCHASRAGEPSAVDVSIYRDVVSVKGATTPDHGIALDHPAAELLHWAAKAQRSSFDCERPPYNDYFLVIGVKSSVISGFHERQAIRETWGDSTTTRANRVRVVFLGCEPNFGRNISTIDREAVVEAIATEKKYFRDLLTHELGGCVDSYFALVNKTMSFFKWTEGTYPHAAYAMIVDDDTYVRVDKLVEMLQNSTTPRRRFYAGQVWATQFNRDIHPIRTPLAKNFVSDTHFPLSTFPPFAAGPQYVLSSDLVRFLARNSDNLRGLGTLEDVSVAYWLLSLLQVQPRHLLQFDNIRFALCHNALISYANLSPSGIRATHANVARKRTLCSNFSVAAWTKPIQEPPLIPLQLLGTGREAQPVEIEWKLWYDWTTRSANIIVSLLALKTNESATVVYTPSSITFIGFCRELYEISKLAMPRMGLDSSFSYELRDGMTTFLQHRMTQLPVLKAFYSLALSNAQQGIFDPAIFVRLGASAVSFRSLIESLMATMYADAHVYVLDSIDYGERYHFLPPNFDIVVAEESRDVVVTSLITRRIIICTETRPEIETDDGRSIYITDRPNDALSPLRTLHIPEVSLDFLNRSNHTPLHLLSVQEVGKGAASRQFLILDCTSLGILALTTAQVLVDILRKQNLTIKSINCDDPTQQNASKTLDEQVLEYSEYKFALVLENRPNEQGHISSKIVTAFLAGCIPIYVGHHRTINRLFNRSAFINCHEFDSIRQCADHVLSVHASSLLYDELRRNPPVAASKFDTFYDAFSWHPAVRDAQAGNLHRLAIADRLKAMHESIEPGNDL